MQYLSIDELQRTFELVLGLGAVLGELLPDCHDDENFAWVLWQMKIVCIVMKIVRTLSAKCWLETKIHPGTTNLFHVDSPS